MDVSINKLCRWLGVPWRMVRYRPVKSEPKPHERLVTLIKAMIAEAPSYGYHTVGHLLGFNKNTVQRIFRLKHWHVRKRTVSLRARINTLPSVAQRPNERWAMETCRAWSGGDRWTTSALLIDCRSRAFLAWHLSRRCRPKTADASPEHALSARFGTLGRVPLPFLLPSDNGHAFTSRNFTTHIVGDVLSHEFITPSRPRQNGMVENGIPKPKEQCVPRHLVESLQHASRVTGDWIGFSNKHRPHHALEMATPAEAYALAA